MKVTIEIKRDSDDKTSLKDRIQKVAGDIEKKTEEAARADQEEKNRAS